MRPEQWQIFKKAARLEKLDRVPMALIIDSPWIPGYVGISHLDFFLDPEVWFQSHLKIHREYPDIIFVPRGGWSTAWRPSPRCWARRSSSGPTTRRASTTRSTTSRTSRTFPPYEVEADAFMALTLHRMKMQRQRILDTGEILPLATSRGPMCTAGFVRSTTEFMIDLVERPGVGAQAPRSVHPADHRLAEGAGQGDGADGRGHLHPRRHRRLRERGALPGVLPSVPQAHLRRVSARTGCGSTTMTPRSRRASSICPTPVSRCSTGASRPTSPT